MKFKGVVVLLLIIPVFSAFALNARDYFPLEIGNTWTYEDSSEFGMDTSVTTIVDTIRMSGYKTYVWVDLWEGSEDTTYIQTRPDGIWFIISIDSTDTMIGKIFPNSFNIGDSWICFSEDSTWVDTTYSYIEHYSLNYHAISFEDITVPAGSFRDCVKLQIIMEHFLIVLSGIDTIYADTTKDDDEYIWLAKDVGHVKSWYLDFDSTETVEVLLSFGTGDIYEALINIPRNISIDVTPNPFNSACNIIVPEHCTVEIIDLQGRLIWSCLNINSKSIVWHPNKSVGSGVYFIRATVDNQTVSKRILYIK